MEDDMEWCKMFELHEDSFDGVVDVDNYSPITDEDSPRFKTYFSEMRSSPSNAALDAEVQPPVKRKRGRPRKCLGSRDAAEARRSEALQSIKARNSKSRKSLSSQSKSILRDWIHQHQDNPYPTPAQKLELSFAARLTVQQVSDWMTNMRKRHLRHLRPLMKAAASRDYCAMDMSGWETTPLTTPCISSSDESDGNDDDDDADDDGADMGLRCSGYEDDNAEDSHSRTDELLATFTSGVGRIQGPWSPCVSRDFSSSDNSRGGVDGMHQRPTVQQAAVEMSCAALSDNSDSDSEAPEDKFPSWVFTSGS